MNVMVPATKEEPRLTANALEVLHARYLKRDDRGAIVETPKQLFQRVACHVADMERRNGGDAPNTAETFYEIAACFVLPVDAVRQGGRRRGANMGRALQCVRILKVYRCN